MKQPFQQSMKDRFLIILKKPIIGDTGRHAIGEGMRVYSLSPRARTTVKALKMTHVEVRGHEQDMLDAAALGEGACGSGGSGQGFF